MKKIKYIDNEEKELIEAFSNIEKKYFKKPSEKMQRVYKKAAKEYLKSEAKMNIRIDPHELEIIKEFAANQGLRYQTFIKSIIHKYITGQLIEKRIK